MTARHVRGDYESLVRRSRAERAAVESGGLPLFAPVRPEPRPAARRTDPWTSHTAAAQDLKAEIRAYRAHVTPTPAPEAP